MKHTKSSSPYDRKSCQLLNQNFPKICAKKGKLGLVTERETARSIKDT
jgi:hypothetical protein